DRLFAPLGIGLRHEWVELGELAGGLIAGRLLQPGLDLELTQALGQPLLGTADDGLLALGLNELGDDRADAAAQESLVERVRVLGETLVEPGGRADHGALVG